MTENEQADRSRDRGVSSLGIVFAVVGFVFLFTMNTPGVGIAFLVLGVVFFASGMRKVIGKRKD